LTMGNVIVKYLDLIIIAIISISLEPVV
jgi:hypothetical protein